MAKQSFNKWVKAAVVALAIAVPSLSQAASCYDSCDPCYNPCDPCASFCDMDFTIGVDFLYWKPCVDDLEYATLLTPSTNTPVATINQSRCYQNVCLDWEPGFRVYLGLPGLCYDFDLNISYTWMRASTGASVDAGVGSSVEPLLAYPGLGDDGDIADLVFDTASARYQLNYNEWDVLFSYRIACNPCHALIPKFGVAGIVLDQELRGQYVVDADNFSDFKATSDYWGVGLRVGSDYEYKLSRCLTFFAAAQGTILAGQKTNTDLSTLTEATPVTGDLVSADFKDCNSTCHLVPGYHLWIGFRYDDRMCDMDYFARIGYEFLNWWNVPNQRTFMGAGAGRATSASVRTLGFHGLFVGVGLSF